MTKTKNKKSFEHQAADAIRNLTVLVVVLAVGVVGTIGIAVVGFVDASHATDAIQQERITTIASACRTQNARNKATITTLRTNAQQALTPDSVTRTQRSLATLGIHASSSAVRRFETLSASQNSQAIGLINALAPVQDCHRAVARATSSHR